MRVRSSAIVAGAAALVLFVGGCEGATTDSAPSSSVSTSLAARTPSLTTASSVAPLTTTGTPSSTETQTVPAYIPSSTTTQPAPQAPGVGGAGGECGDGSSYVNSDGNCIHDPEAGAGAAPPAGATAQCSDGTYSFSQHRSGTCSRHGGVAHWL